MKFSGKMCLMIILKATKNQGFTLSLEDTFFEKPQGRFRVKLFRNGAKRQNGTLIPLLLLDAETIIYSILLTLIIITKILSGSIIK